MIGPDFFSHFGPLENCLNPWKEAHLRFGLGQVEALQQSVFYRHTFPAWHCCLRKRVRLDMLAALVFTITLRLVDESHRIKESTCKLIPILMPRPPLRVASSPSFLQWTIMVKWLLERTGCGRKKFSVNPRCIKRFGMILNRVAADSPILCVFLTNAEVWEKSSWTILDNFLFNVFQTLGKGMKLWSLPVSLGVGFSSLNLYTVFVSGWVDCSSYEVGTAQALLVQVFLDP